jgi:hypothetical protein
MFEMNVGRSYKGVYARMGSVGQSFSGSGHIRF